MTAVSFSINRGSDGLRPADISVGTSAPGTGDSEFRWNLLDANGGTQTRKDLIIALQAFIVALESGNLITNASAL
jgi:hypothetical protein